MSWVNPGRGSFQFSQRRNALAFWIGSAVVSVGVVLHLPMFWMARNSRFNMSGMPMDAEMLFGMLLIICGIAAAGYGLLPNHRPAAGVHRSIAPPEDAPLTAAHWKLMGVLGVALVIDIMKPPSLGWLPPGQR